MTTEAGRYVVRSIERSEIGRVAEIQYDAFNDPTNQTHDEMSEILGSEVDPEAGRPLSREETIAKRIKSETELFDKNTYIYIGAYLLPPNSSSSSDDVAKGVSEETADLSSSSLPAGSTLAGFGVWQKVTPSTPSEWAEKQRQAEAEPTLLNRFFAQMIKTREETMHNQSYYFLKLLCIHPHHQRKGIGSLLVKWGVQKANLLKQSAWLESSPMGKGTYLKAGFKVLGLDRVPEPRAKNGYIEWPYMIHQYSDPSPQ